MGLRNTVLWDAKLGIYSSLFCSILQDEHIGMGINFFTIIHRSEGYTG
jgi:hypothetical protein